MFEARLLTFAQKGDDRGHLVVVEAMKNIPFEMKRVFYMYGTKDGVVRGHHANLRTAFVLINLAGTLKVKVDNGWEERVFCLDQPHTGIYLPPMYWKDMYDFSADSVLLCLASEPYDETEYVRDYAQFLQLHGT